MSAKCSKQVRSAHNKWVVFKGDSSDIKDIIFITKISTLEKSNISLDVFLGFNEKDVCDYKVKGSWHDRSCTIYAGESTTVVGQVNRMLNLEFLCLHFLIRVKTG